MLISTEAPRRPWDARSIWTRPPCHQKGRSCVNRQARASYVPCWSMMTSHYGILEPR